MSLGGVVLGLWLQATAPECPEPYEVCLTAPVRDRLVAAVEELESIHETPAVLTVEDPIVVVRDWENRVYVNGGDTKPLRMRLRIGETIDRELAVTVPVQVHYHAEPPEPWLTLRVRVRVQAGLLVPEMLVSARDGEGEPFWYAGLDLDWLKADVFNAYWHVGTAGPGLGMGVDITENFGSTVGMLVRWDGWTPTMATGLYFSF